MSKRKVPCVDDNKNVSICEFLLELADYEKNVNRNIHKYNAYRKASNSIAAYGTKLRSGEEAKKLDGVGKKIALKIDEFLQTGKLRKLENVRSDERSAALRRLCRVSGIGPSKARQLVDQGITTLDHLRRHKHTLNHHQLIGLKYLEDFEKKIPRSEIEDIERRLRAHIGSLDSEFLVTICGSYRRGKAESGDVDALITHPKFTSKTLDKSVPSKLLKRVVHKLEEESLVTDTISLGHVKFMGVCKVGDLGRRLDIRLTPRDQYYCAVLYFTGSDMFNQQMRTHALHTGFTLNEYSLRPLGSTGVPGEPVPVASERDIFDYINYPYKEPSERE